MSNAPCELLEWDTRFFGLRVARVTRNVLTGEELSHVLEWCKIEGVNCLYWLAPSNDADIVRLAEQHQFSLVDIRITLETELPASSANSSTVRAATAEDIPFLAGIAKTAHTDSRFYYDSGFSRQCCDELYQTWIKKSCQGYAKTVLVAMRSGAPAGYITCDYTDRIGEIGLIAVAEWARGAGLGGELITSSFHFFRHCGVDRVQVVTQGRNIAAQRLYQRFGFLTRTVELWYHRWFSQVGAD